MELKIDFSRFRYTHNFGAKGIQKRKKKFLRFPSFFLLCEQNNLTWPHFHFSNSGQWLERGKSFTFLRVCYYCEEEKNSVTVWLKCGIILTALTLKKSKYYNLCNHISVIITLIFSLIWCNKCEHTIFPREIRMETAAAYCSFATLIKVGDPVSSSFLLLDWPFFHLIFPRHNNNPVSAEKIMKCIVITII